MHCICLKLAWKHLSKMQALAWLFFTLSSVVLSRTFLGPTQSQIRKIHDIPFIAGKEEESGVVHPVLENELLQIIPVLLHPALSVNPTEAAPPGYSDRERQDCGTHPEPPSKKLKTAEEENRSASLK